MPGVWRMHASLGDSGRRSLSPQAGFGADEGKAVYAEPCRELLAAHVTADRAQADCDAGRSTPVPVYLPRGSWINLFTGRVVSGGRTITDGVGLAEVPFYMRAGTAIGWDARTPDVWANGWATDALTQPGLADWMYAPGGRAAAISSSSGTLTAATAGRRITSCRAVHRGATRFSCSPAARRAR